MRSLEAMGDSESESESESESDCNRQTRQGVHIRGILVLFSILILINGIILTRLSVN